jgi:hypothetical protein
MFSKHRGLSMNEQAEAASQAMISKWECFLGAMGEAAGQPAPGERRGSLLVIGSGLSHVDLMLNDEAEIRAADRVFHLLYDRVTQIWINEIRPDALDLRIFYREDQDRYQTYVQMAEVMMHCVRHGEKVLAVYYGHPGVFAMPTHRAIKLARSEGYHAKMRPGISALDYLIADVGFDPISPGLVSFEASDLLLRRRVIDTSLHVILWQVGVVGEFKFSAGGFENQGFDLLIDELQARYGAEWEITHYVAPQYVGVEPMIDRHTIASLRTEEVRRRICVHSTFYIEPQTVAATDLERSVALGFSAPGEYVAPQARLFDHGTYGPLEAEAVGKLAGFAAPPYYSSPPQSPGAEFMLAVSRDIGLQARYRDDPATVLGDPRFAGLSERARELLAIQHPLAINAGIAEAPAAQRP